VLDCTVKSGIIQIHNVLDRIRVKHDPPLLDPRFLPADAESTAGALLSAREVLPEFDFAAIKETRIDALFDAWMELPKAARVRLETELREICDMACAVDLAGVALMTIDGVSLLAGRRASTSA